MRWAVLGKSFTCHADDAIARVKAGRATWDPEVRKGAHVQDPAGLLDLLADLFKVEA